MIRSWLLAFRLKTLTAALVPVMVAGAFATFQGYQISFFLLGCLVTSALSIQIATNLFNDAIDFKKGADQVRVGPVRVTQSGLIGIQTVYGVALGFCLLALASGIPLVIAGGGPLVLIGLTSLLLAYGYTGGPFPLAYLGLGDLFVVLYFGVIAVAASFYILAGEWSLASLLLGLQVGFLSTVLIALNNLRDRPEDEKVNKKTWAVLFGDRFVQWEITMLIFSSYAFSVGWSLFFDKKLFLIYLFTIPLAFKILKIVFNFSDRKQLISCLGQSAGLHLLFGVCFILGCIL